MENNSNSNMLVPGAIIIAGVLIAGAIVYSGNSSFLGQGGGSAAPQRAAVADSGGTGTVQPSDAPSSTENIKAVTSDDHIRGSIDAPVKIVEFSDLECPFCKRFHSTLQQVYDEYDGDVAWVYRHFPLDALHPKARKEAEATECAAELGGNEKFWAYLDRIMEVTPSNNRLDESELPKIAAHVGLNVQEFQACLDSGRHKDKVESDVQDALASGGLGTPYSILIGPDGKKAVISGAQPYAQVKSAVDAALK